MADPHKTVRQQVQAEPPEEFHGRQGHRFFPPTFFVVFPIKGHRFFRHAFYPVVRNGGLVRVPAQVFDHRPRARERALGIDHPFLSVQFFPQGGGQVYCPRFCRRFQPRHKSALEDHAQGIAGKEVFPVRTRRFPLARLRHPPARDDAVQVRVQAHVLPPCVQDRRHAGLRTQVFRVF